MTLTSVIKLSILSLITFSCHRLISGATGSIQTDASSEPTSTPSAISTSYPSLSTISPTAAITTAPPSYLPTHPFSTVINGGFESDVKVVEANGGSLSMLPTGWTLHKSTMLISYSTDENYRHDNSGEIFLSISSVESGYIEQDIYACTGVSLTLSFDATVFRDCQECSAASFAVYVDSTAIFMVEDTPHTWQQYHGTFASPGSVFALKFQPTENSQFFQLFLDNINLTPHSGTCSPTSLPTQSESPSIVPSLVPTPRPSPNPTTAHPTSEAVVLTVEGRLILGHVSYHDQLNSLDLISLKSVLGDIMHIGSRNVHGFTRISMVDSKRIDDEDIALIFNVDIMAGRHNISAFDFGLVFNETRGYLWIATEETDIFLSRLAMALESLNGTSLGVYSVSTVTLDYFRIGDGVHSLQSNDFAETLTVALLAGLFGFLSIFIVYTIVMRMMYPAKQIKVNTEEENMLMEMGSRSVDNSWNQQVERGNVINWESSHSDLSTSQKAQVTKGFNVSQQCPSERSFETPVSPFSPLMDSHSSEPALNASIGKSVGAASSISHTYDYEGENDGKFYSAYASKKKAPESKGPAQFEKIDQSFLHSSIPELLP